DVNDVTITVTNTGGVNLLNCVVTDTNFTSSATCPPTGNGTPVTLDPPGTISSPLVPTGSATVTAKLTGLTSNSCDEASVVCDVPDRSRQVTAKDDKVCPAFVPGGCRTTGGGITDACGPALAGGDAPAHCKNPSDDALDATHGGQVGASVGVATAF